MLCFTEVIQGDHLIILPSESKIIKQQFLQNLQKIITLN